VFAAAGRCIGGRRYQRTDLTYQQIVCRWLHDLLLRSRSDEITPDFGSPQAGKSQESQMLAATDCARFTRLLDPFGTIEPWLNPTR
jgi:hypothetical protein